MCVWRRRTAQACEAAAAARLRAQVLRRVPAAMAADAGAATAMLRRHFPDSHAAVLAQLQPDPQLQFAYLRALITQRAAAHGGGGGGGGELQELLRDGTSTSNQSITWMDVKRGGLRASRVMAKTGVVTRVRLAALAAVGGGVCASPVY